MRIPTRFLFVTALVGLSAFLAAGNEPPKAGGPGRPLPPPEALKQFRLDAGLRLELVAAEPLVQSPVAIAFGADGKLWVVEMHDYPNGPPAGQPPQGRVRVLEDRDGDGTYDHASTFADKLLFANGLLPWKDGVLVTAAPYIVHLRDTDGDGKADRRDVLYEGFAAQNPQLRVSHPNLGIDGWVYVANGLRGGQVKRAGTDGPPINLSGLDFRFDPVHDRAEAVSGPGQFGNTFDAWGQRFVCDNRHHLRHVVFDNRYLKRNPLLAAPSLVEDTSVLEGGPLSSGGKIYPLSRNWTTSSLHEGRFTAACGVYVYKGQLLGAPYEGAALTCDPTGNLVHLETLKQSGATFASKPHKQGVEFLATPNDWFRPVSLATGPDDALYVVDMYRAVIEHPEFMPPELKNRPDLLLGKDRGRIWRIVPEGHTSKPTRPNLHKATTAELVARLADDRPWWRTTAQRLLLERQDPAMAEPLRKLFDATQKPLARLHAAWLLEGVKQLDDARLLKLLHDEHPRLREHGVLLAEPRLTQSEKLRQRVVALAKDADPRVRFQVALTLGDARDDSALTALAEIARAGCDDRWTRLAVASAVPEAAADVLLRFLKLPNAAESLGRLAMVRELAAVVGARKDAAAFARVAGQLLSPSPKAEQLAGLVGLADGLERRGKTLTSVAKELPGKSDYPAAMNRFLTDALPRVANAQTPAEQRLLLIRLFAHAPWPQAKATLLPLLNDAPEQEIRLAALRSLAAHAEKEVPGLLMQSWRSASPAVRREMLETMLRRPDRLSFLLDEIAAKRVRPSEIDAVRSRQLMKHANPAIRDKARQLLQNNLPADREAVLKQYQAALHAKGDGKRGQEIFRKNCATCHKVAGVGTDVGPDIADTRTKTPDALLADILLPNRAIDNNYVNYLVTTKDGRSLSGLLTAETASSITLKRAEGQSDVVLRQDIDEIASTGVSLMPEGLEKGINVQEMADLLSFLKNWRYLDGSVPLGQKN